MEEKGRDKQTAVCRTMFIDRVVECSYIYAAVEALVVKSTWARRKSGFISQMQLLFRGEGFGTVKRRQRFGGNSIVLCWSSFSPWE